MAALSNPNRIPIDGSSGKPRNASTRASVTGATEVNTTS